VLRRFARTEGATRAQHRCADTQSRGQNPAARSQRRCHATPCDPIGFIVPKAFRKNIESPVCRIIFRAFDLRTTRKLTQWDNGERYHAMMTDAMRIR
jgi:hypothetical protein